MRISIVRGAFVNPFELQNYYPLKNKFDIRVFSSLHPLSSDIKLPLTRLVSPTDLPSFPYKYSILNRLFTDAHYLYKLEEHIAGSDIVHVAETYYHYTIQAINAKNRGLVKKIVSTVWEVIPHNNESIRGRKKFKQLSYQYVDHFLAVTSLAKAALLEEGIDTRKITVLPMGVDINRFRPIKKTSSHPVKILCVARLTPEKGIAELLKAFVNLSKKYSIQLTLVGSGPLAKDIPHTNQIFVKSIPYSQIQKEYQAADIFCLPSKPTLHWQEQYGMALVEALACGLSIVTTRSGAIPQVCQDAAFYARPGNVSELQSKLEVLIGSPPTRFQMGRQARNLAEHTYDHRHVAVKIGEIYRSL